MEINEQIRKLREKKGWTQGELAKKMGFATKASICLIESGQRRVSASKVVRFAKIFGITPTELLGWGKPLPDEDLALIEEVCQDVTLYNRLMDYVRKLKEIKDAETS